MKTINDNRQYHRLGAFTNDYHLMYRKQQYQKYMRDTFRTRPDKWRAMMRAKLHRKPR